MESQELIAVLAFAGVLVGVLAGALGNRALMRRNNKHNPGNPDGDGVRAAITALATEMGGIRSELKGIRSGQGKLLDAIGNLATDIGILKDRGERSGS